MFHTPPPHPPGPPHHPGPHGFGFPPDEHGIGGLREMMGSRNPPRTALELAELADRIDPQSELGAYIRAHGADLPPALALEDAAVHQRKATYRSIQQVRERAEGGALVCIPPLPRHILEPLVTSPSVTLVEIGQVPPHFRHDPRVPRIVDAYAARDLVEQADLIVFDGRFHEGVLHVRRALAALLDPRTLKATAILFVHFRGRAFPEDLPLSPELSGRFHRI